jgi:hypothetical protein
MAEATWFVAIGALERVFTAYPACATAEILSARHVPLRRAFVHEVILERAMIILGIVLLILGFVFSIHILWILGIIALVIGAILAIAGLAGREVAGRRHWY